MKKKNFYTEIAYFLGVILVALGTALVERANFGVSMVVAPAYVIYQKLSQTFSFFTFGMAEYLLQGLLILLIIIIVRKIKVSFFFSFVTAIIYAFFLDGFISVMDLIAADGMLYRIICYIIGLPITSCGVAFFFKTYISPEAYELFVKEISSKFNIEIHKFKTAYDCVSCVVGLALSFILFGFGNFVGVNIGTVICAIINGFLIGRFSKFFDNRFVFVDKFNLRKYFE